MRGRVVIITGANAGIGFHMASALLEGGYRVAALDLTGENLVPLRQLYADSLRFHSCDVREEKLVHAAVSSVVREWGRVDILVNNACLAVFGFFEEKSLRDVRSEFEVNYFGYLNMIRAVLPHMKARRKGVIHNVSSGVGITGFPGVYGYASSKAAIEALTRALALELAPYGIAVNLIHPPLTATKSSSPLGIPKRLMADPADVGRKLARKVGSRKALITPDLRTALGLFLSRHFPETVGKFLTRLTLKAKAGAMLAASGHDSE